jgi:hypothetical protein
MEDIAKGEQVFTGMFALNGYPIVNMFDSSATYNFINKACTQNCQLTIMHLSAPYMISTLGGNIITNYLARNTPLNLVGKIYKIGLIVLDGQGIDVILGMGWMQEFKALLDIAARTVQLETLVQGIAILQLPSPIVIALTLHNITAPCLEDILVVREFLDVFPSDLSHMALDKDVESTIELQPGETPISRQPDKMIVGDP